MKRRPGIITPDELVRLVGTVCVLGILLWGLWDSSIPPTEPEVSTSPVLVVHNTPKTELLPFSRLDSAVSLSYEYGEAWGVDPNLVLGVILTENPWLDPEAVSSHGSVGLMQVTPRFWAGRFPECHPKGHPEVDLTDPRQNVCYGTAILASLLERYDRTEALLRYNGCRGVYLLRSPSCVSYPDTVEARGGL